MWQYAKMGVLWVGVKEIIRCMVHGRSLKTVYPRVTKLVDKELVNKYETELKLLQSASNACYENENKNLNDNVNLNVNDNLEPARSAFELPPQGVVWFCWLQGMENAPELVKECLERLRASIGEEVIVLDDRNYGEYVELPEYVVRKYRKGIIPPALFSDLLRLELLIRYGGTWIDATVWTSPEVGVKDSKCWMAWKKIRESDLFIYRYFNREGRVEGMSNWFIHAKADNALLKDVRDMLYAYWRDYNCVVEYYIFHLFFSHAAKRYPEMIRRMPRGNSYHALWMAHHAERGISDADWQKLMANVPFHKLNYRRVPKVRLN